MVCVADLDVCMIAYDDLLSMVKKRRKLKGNCESQYSVMAVCPKGKGFKVYMNMTGFKKKLISPILNVPRNKFPGGLFDG